jgi:hypothetical protein
VTLETLDNFELGKGFGSFGVTTARNEFHGKLFVVCLASNKKHRSVTTASKLFDDVVPALGVFADTPVYITAKDKYSCKPVAQCSEETKPSYNSNGDYDRRR